MPRKTARDEWIIALDEFHPDPRVAAKYADQNARLAARKFLTEDIKRLLAKREPLTPDEAARLESCRYHLKITNEAIEDFLKEEADE